MSSRIALVLTGDLEISRCEVDEIARRLNTREIFHLGDAGRATAQTSDEKVQCFADWHGLVNAAGATWLCFFEGVAPLADGEFDWRVVEQITAEANKDIDVVINHGSSEPEQTLSRVSVRQLELVPSLPGGWLIRAEAFRRLIEERGGASLDPISPQALLRTWLLRQGGSFVGVLGEAQWKLSSEPHFDHWCKLDTYGRRLSETCLEPLQLSTQTSGRAPRWLQRAVVDQLHWYFDVDLRERAPTVVINRNRAPAFHECIGQILTMVDVETIHELQALGVRQDVIHALLSYIVQPMYDKLTVDAYDSAQQLARLRYFLHGHWRSETFSVGGRSVTPTYAKYRACKFFTRTLYWQRVIWLPMSPGDRLACVIDSHPVQVVMAGREEQQPDARGSLLPIEKLSRPTKGGQQPIPFNRRGLKARALRTMARLPWIRSRFRDAWVFVDRDEDADDNAEHMYRWMVKHHPEINSWFLLKPGTPDWVRLEKEGFRLIPPGLLRKLLLLNTRFIVSSHAQYMNGGFDPALYGDMMNWRYVFPQHGVIKDDLSHWLGELGFDIFTTSSPAEHESVVGNDTAYQYTEREVYRTGLPRHDRLLRMVAEVDRKDLDVILVMPTWRGGLVDRRAEKYADLLQAFAESEYVRVWGSFLRNPEVHALCERHGKRIVFMPHANVAPYVAAFNLPGHIQIATSPSTSIQTLFSKSAALITDYTSVAFTFALLRRTVFYYQYDRDDFFGGGHNWREGYFDFECDGFGPVVFDEKTLIGALAGFLENDSRPEPAYLDRMVKAMPETDGKSCERLYQVIVEIDSPQRPTRSQKETA